VERVRAAFGGAVWAVIRVADALPAHAADLFGVADAVVLDARVPGRLGGTGTTFDWAAVRGPLERARARGSARLVVAGGLTPDNVGDAVRAVRPFGVDVAGGVERAPGRKDPELVRRFVAAARAALEDP
jgi:phosphoribosylanthranilate isomerase